jgi:hypothetical protein
LALLLVAVALAVWSRRSADVAPPGEDPEAVRLAAQLRDPRNKTKLEIYMIPDGEYLAFTEPMLGLMRLGDRALPTLHRLLKDEAIQNEVVLVLGAIGDRTTVPLLIEAYPEDDARGLQLEDPRRMKVTCFTHALTYLTAQPIGRSRYGADCEPNNRKLWQRWWRENEGSFVVPVEKPLATWVPAYPAPESRAEAPTDD